MRDWVRRGRPAALGVVGVLAVAVLWEVYKIVGPQGGWIVHGVTLLPRANDGVMPHVWDMLSRFGQPEISWQPGITIGSKVIAASLYSLSLSAVGWLLGVIVGFLIALVMTRFRLAEAAALPWVVASQTVPLIAIAPVLGGWGQFIHIGSWTWDNQASIIVISAYLAFFPMAVGTLRGLKSPSAAQLELMEAYAVGWWRTLVTLRLPASVPHLLPALRLSATSAVVGAVVGEVAIGQDGGIGRLILAYAKNAYADPPKAWPPIFGAMCVGLVAAGVVALIGLSLRRYRRSEA